MKAFGGEISREGSNEKFPENSQDITIQIVDRDSQKKQYLTRIYVQPQWVFGKPKIFFWLNKVDSVNEQKLLPAQSYLPTVPLPPHLSPFVDDSKEGYIPHRREELDLLTSVDSLHVILAPKKTSSQEKKLEIGQQENDEEDEESEEESEEEEEEEEEGEEEEESEEMQTENGKEEESEDEAVDKDQMKEESESEDEEEEENADVSLLIFVF